MAYANNNKLSMEMAAREIRYRFFEELCSIHNLDCVAVAHHNNDVVETFFINLMRGTGLQGLSGINSKNGRVVRPMLACSHEQILDYLDLHHIEYRVDKSNFDTSILRNKIRHDIIPELEDRKPGFVKLMQGTIARLKESEKMVSAYVEDWRKRHVREEDGLLYIEKRTLFDSVSPSEILFKLLSAYGFSSKVIDELSAGAGWRVGAVFESHDYRIIIDREALIVAPFPKTDDEYLITNIDDFKRLPVKFTAKVIPGNEVELKKDSNVAFMDYSQLKFPLTLRHWKEGDFFYPFGMKGKRKKMSDFFIDCKMSLIEKENVWVLLSGDDVCWVVGKRTDERFRVSLNDSDVLQLVFET